ncbi:MAG: NAD(P)H-binding protein [Bacteroidales bacterium]|nr:NAD(P)H-binding protein [Bacteroidales bacterium]MCF8343639.1 NAD(P)H-binding protein [Bacteroidales bacterium]MCF8375181.1 NAD(P)H-binding protein [Bacteroidales bacterium]MCF8400697.1 NAD(P)H-binding protein [Bacteroidales bacterium]
MQTILGAGGAIGQELAKALTKFTKDIRLVSRNPKKISENDQLFSADLTKNEEVDKAIEGSEIVYLTVGFEYKTKVWREKWPLLMRNVIDACKNHNTKLVFFDNVYMYDKEFINHMTEETPIRPSSKKGEVRNEISQMLMDEVEKDQLTALIARSADFLGVHNSIPVEMAAKPLLKNKKANWISGFDKIHSFTYIPDAAEGTAILGNAPEAYGQVWHLPTDPSPLTARQWVDMIAEEAGTKPRYNALPVWMMRIAGLLSSIMREFPEMAYQYDRDYFFDSSKFNEHFKYTPVKPKAAVKEVMKELKKG